MSYEQMDILAAAIIAAGMYNDPRSVNWTREEIAHDAVVTLKEIKKQLRNDSAKE